MITLSLQILEQNSLFFCVCVRGISSAIGSYIISKDNESSETILRIRTLTLTTKTVKKIKNPSSPR